MKLEEVNTRTKEAVDFLVAALESGHSEVLTTYLRFLAERLSANGRGFSQGRANASRRATLTGSLPVCMLFRKTKARCTRRDTGVVFWDRQRNYRVDECRDFL
jgi:hypothetical protein